MLYNVSVKEVSLKAIGAENSKFTQVLWNSRNVERMHFVFGFYPNLKWLHLPKLRLQTFKIINMEMIKTINTDIEVSWVKYDLMLLAQVDKPMDFSW